jgi:hypothetical protein
MNTLFGDMAANLSAFNPEEEAIIATKRAEAEIIDFNVEDQLYEKGINSQGKSIGDYQPFTIAKKEGEGKRTSNVTLRDEGDFHSSFKVKYGKDRFEITASDPKTEKLQKNWGKDILGLTTENLQHIKDDFILPHLRSKLRQIL